jgi:hypothetical protein
MAHKQNITMESLLLRINSALHVQKPLSHLINEMEGKYRDLLRRHNVPESYHLEALEATLQHDQKVRCFASIPTYKYAATGLG